jgi:hypothetical protein
LAINNLDCLAALLLNKPQYIHDILGGYDKIPIFSDLLMEKDVHFESLSRVATERERQIADLSRVATEREGYLAELRQSLVYSQRLAAEYLSTIEDLQRSIFGRIMLLWRRMRK